MEERRKKADNGRDKQSPMKYIFIIITAENVHKGYSRVLEF